MNFHRGLKHLIKREKGQAGKFFIFARERKNEKRGVREGTKIGRNLQITNDASICVSAARPYVRAGKRMRARAPA